MENFKLQVDARSAAMDSERLHRDPARGITEFHGVVQPPQKRRRIAHEEFQEGNALDGEPVAMDVDMDFGMGNHDPAGFGAYQHLFLENTLIA